MHLAYAYYDYYDYVRGLCVDYAYYDSPSASAVRPSICDDLEYDAHLREVVSRVGVE